MKNKKRVVVIIAVILGSLLVWNLFREKRYVTDSDFVMKENTLSPDGKHRAITFRIDAGAFGDGIGRVAITPPEYQNLNLANYEIPLCYESFGWTDANELIVSIDEYSPNITICEPNQYELKTGDILQGVKVQVVNADEFLLKQGMKRGKTVPPPSEPK
jgi:hypothetical protein